MLFNEFMIEVDILPTFKLIAILASLGSDSCLYSITLVVSIIAIFGFVSGKYTPVQKLKFPRHQISPRAWAFGGTRKTFFFEFLGVGEKNLWWYISRQAIENVSGGIHFRETFGKCSVFFRQ